MSARESAAVDVVVVGSGSAALCAAMAALDNGASVLVVEKAPEHTAGGNSRYTAGAMRFAYDSGDQLLSLLEEPGDERVAMADFGSYPQESFSLDLAAFNQGEPMTPEQTALVEESYPTLVWLGEKGVRFEPIWDRQAFVKDGRHVFWGGLTLAVRGEGVGLVDAEMEIVRGMGGRFRYDAELVDLVVEADVVRGVVVQQASGVATTLRCGSVILACGGFEANADERVSRLGSQWEHAKVRGTPHNTGRGIELALAAGAVEHGLYDMCHATPMDRDMPNYGNLDLPHDERKHYRKISYFLGVMLNADGLRFVDEGQHFRNYTYAQFGRAVLDQPGQVAWQFFDHKVADLLYAEYSFHDAHFTEAGSLPDLLATIEGIDRDRALATLSGFNEAVREDVAFDPTVLDGREAIGLEPPRSNWAQRLDMAPFRAYPVTGGITFTYGGLRVGEAGEVLRPGGSAIDGLFACGELVGGVFSHGYPGGSGLTSGAVFGRRAGGGAARFATTAAS